MKSACVLFVVVASAICLVLTTLAAKTDDDCGPGFHKVGERKTETATKIIVQDVCDPDDPSAQRRQAIQDEIHQAKGKVNADEEQFRRLGLGATTDAFETWAELSEEQQDKIIVDSSLSAISALVQIVKVGRGPVGSFTPPQANSMITRLRSVGVSIPSLEKEIRAVAATSGKPEMAKMIAKVADTIGKVAERGAITRDALNGERLQVLAGVLSVWLVKTPDQTGAVALGEALINFYFAEKAIGVIEPDLNQAMDIPDQQLASVRRLSLKLNKDVNELNGLKKQLTQMH